MGKGFHGTVISREEADERTVAVGSDVCESLSLSAELDLGGVSDVETATMIANVRAKVPRCGGCLNGGIAAEDHDGWRGFGIVQRCGAVGGSSQGLGERDVVGGSVVIDVIGAENGAC